MDKAPMEIHFDPKTLICFIVMGIIAIIIVAKANKED